jgi:hypothetical protein
LIKSNHTENDKIKELEVKLTEMENEKKKIQNENVKMKQMIENINKDSLSSIQTSQFSKDSIEESIFGIFFDQIEEKNTKNKNQSFDSLVGNKKMKFTGCSLSDILSK